MMFSYMDDLRPLPVFLRTLDEQTSEAMSEKHLYKPTQYHLTMEKRLLTFNKEETPTR